MADGTELFLGFTRPEIDGVLEQLGLTIDWETHDILPEDKWKNINERLKVAWQNCCKDLGLKFASRRRQSWELYLHLNREYDEEEDQAILGISLISRYSPTFLDYRSPSGGSGDMVCLNDETMKMIEAAKKSIATVLPPWENSHICFKMIFY